MLQLVGLLVTGGLLWSYSLVWLNEELVLVLSFLLFCFLVNKFLGNDYVEFVASRALQVQQHALVLAKQYMLRDLQKQKELQQALVLTLSQAAKAFLIQTVVDLSKNTDSVQNYKAKSAMSSVVDLSHKESDYVNSILASADNYVYNRLVLELSSADNTLLVNQLFKMDYNLHTATVGSSVFVLPLLLLKK